jgi:hypothetical protein
MLLIAVGLLACSAVLYALHYLLFHDPHHIFIYLVGDLAIIPLEVLIVALVIERLLARHERRSLLHKMNMVIGTFFSEVGTWLLGELTRAVDDADEVYANLGLRGNWKAPDYRRALAFVHNHRFAMDLGHIDLAQLRDRLVGERDHLVRLLGNPNLLEHDQFTDLLWSVFHLMEELTARDSFEALPDADSRHLQGDVRRVYAALTLQWLLYCRHLQSDYPYIFSIVVRTHPLQDHPRATVTE